MCSLLRELLAQFIPINADKNEADSCDHFIGLRKLSEVHSKPDAVLVRQVLLPGTLGDVCRSDGADSPAERPPYPTYLPVTPNATLAAALTSGLL